MKTKSNNNQKYQICHNWNKIKPHRVWDEHSNEKLPMHLIPGTDRYLCEDCYLRDKINRWWYQHKKPINIPQMQDHPLGRIRPTPYFEFSKIESEIIPLTFQN